MFTVTSILVEHVNVTFSIQYDEGGADVHHFMHPPDGESLLTDTHTPISGISVNQALTV